MLQDLFRYKGWANQELFEAVSRIDASQHAKALHTITRLLNHIYVVDKIFSAHLLGRSHGYTATNTPTTPELATLCAEQTLVDQWYLDHVSNLDGAALSESLKFAFTDGETGCMTRGEILLHVHTHGAYHRGQIGAMLTEASVQVPRDLYTRYLHLTQALRRQH